MGSVNRTLVAISLTQDRLVEEGSNLRELLEFLRGRISLALIGEHEWQRIATLAKTLPITMGAQPFGFELPLHDSRPTADMGVSLASGNRSGNHFEERARRDGTDETAGAVKRLFAEMETANSPLQTVVGRKLMLEYDIGSASGGDIPAPGIFLRPNERTLFGGAGLERDVGTVVDAWFPASAGATSPPNGRTPSGPTWRSRSTRVSIRSVSFRLADAPSVWQSWVLRRHGMFVPILSA